MIFFLFRKLLFSSQNQLVFFSFLLKEFALSACSSMDFTSGSITCGKNSKFFVCLLKVF